MFVFFCCCCFVFTFTETFIRVLVSCLFLVFEPVEMVIDLVHMQAQRKGYNREQYKGIEVFI